MKPSKLVTFAFVITLAFSLSGCSLCCSPYLDDYAAYGSRTPRMDMKNGRVGSVFSDPQLTSGVITSSDPSFMDEPIVYLDDEGNEVELASGSKAVMDVGPWGDVLDAIDSVDSFESIEIVDP